MAAMIYGRNGALDTNPPAGDQYLSVNGSDWLYTVCAIFTVSFVSWPPSVGRKE
jgi:bacteriorhodopsin